MDQHERRIEQEIASIRREQLQFARRSSQYNRRGDEMHILRRSIRNLRRARDFLVAPRTTNGGE
jgi:hypothetical protein